METEPEEIGSARISFNRCHFWKKTSETGNLVFGISCSSFKKPDFWFSSKRAAIRAYVGIVPDFKLGKEKDE
jgi:hypothetical protein